MGHLQERRRSGHVGRRRFFLLSVFCCGRGQK